MHRLSPRQIANQQGSTLAATSILLAVAAVGIGAIMMTMGMYGQTNETEYNYERAVMLADAGVSAAVFDLNHGGTGAISTNTSRGYFSSTNRFNTSNWSFETAVSDVSSSNKQITATGHYKGVNASVAMNALLHTTSDTIHSLYATAIYAGNSSGSNGYALAIGGTGSGADFVNGDVYVNGNIVITGNAKLRHPEAFTDTNGNGQWDDGEPWNESGNPTVFSNAMTQAAFNSYKATTNGVEFYGDGRFDLGEAFVDTVGNGTYDSSEGFTDLNGNDQYDFGEPFVDANGNGIYDPGEAFVDKGNGVWNTGEQWSEDTSHSQRVNGRYDPAGGYYTSTGTWKTTYKVGYTTYSCSSWAAEPFSDEGNGSWDPGETYSDRNATYDVGEAYLDDRNGLYDYGAAATGTISGMTAAAAGQIQPTGHSPSITPPDLQHMYYNLPKTGYMPLDALDRWGNDIDVSSQTFNSSGKITDTNNPAHIFVKNVTGRTYTKITGKDDYFLEDPNDSSYASGDPKYIAVKDNGNNKVYYINGNLYIHNPNTLNFAFRNPGTKITIVAKGNITISDELRYNGLTTNPVDAVAFIALKDSAQTNSGNIYLGDAQFGTGGEIHAMLYAENDFRDNNLNTTNQPTLSVFGTMSAGNLVSLNRPAVGFRTRLDVTLDQRIRSGLNVPPGLPPAWANQRAIYIYKGWTPISGTYTSYSRLR